MQILRKELSRKVVDNNKEVVEYEYYEKDLLTDEEIEKIREHYDDDEHAYMCGLAIDWNDDLVWIDIDNFVEELEGYLSDEDNKEYYTYDTFKAIFDKLSEYKGFTLWL